MTDEVKKKPSLILNIGLWTAQAMVSAMFLMGAVMKLTTPIEKLSQMMPWTGQVDPLLVTITGVFDGLGGIGIILPALTRIQPRLTILAAYGCFALQICALIFHISRGEGPMMAPINILLAGLSVFVIWGRGKAAPITPR